MRTLLAVACGALLAAGPAAAQSQNGNSTSQPQSQSTNSRSQTQRNSSSRAQRDEPMVAGVVTNVDQSGHELTLVAPAGAEVDVSRVGQQLFVERGVNLLSVKAPIENSAKVWIDGQQSSLANLKEGDVVRAAFDPNQQQFVDVRAVTPQEMSNDMTKARTDLRMSGSSNRSSGSSNGTAGSNQSK